MKLSISVTEVRQLQKRRDQINRVPLEDIRWYNTMDDVIHISKKTIEDFKETGLNNTDFILGEYYKGGEN